MSNQNDLNQSNTNTLNIYNGPMRLASVKELIDLKDKIESLLIGNPHDQNLNKLSKDGYIPWVYNADGSVDIETLFPDLLEKIKETGINILYEDNLIAEGIKTINFRGNYVNVYLDENQNLVLNIDKQSSFVPNFNEENEFSSALVKIDTPITSGLIIPNANTNSKINFGDWESGSEQIGFNYHINNILYLTTLGPVYARTKETYFEIHIDVPSNNSSGYNYESFESFYSKKITSNSINLLSQSLNTSDSINIEILEFTESSNGYSFIPKFKIDLSKIFTDNSSRFRIRILHKENINSQNITTEGLYVSPDFLYNRGSYPEISETNWLCFNPNNVVKYCSGIEYLKSGEIRIKLNQIHNLNTDASTKTKFKFNNIDEYFVMNDSSMKSDNYSLKIDNISDWYGDIQVKPNILNINEIQGVVYPCNGLGIGDEKIINLNILIDSTENPNKSNNLTEYFSDESYRQMNEPLNSDVWNSMTDISTSYSLMVIPNSGLVYPNGDWSKFRKIDPLSNTDSNPYYNNLNGKRYYSRYFTSQSLDKNEEKFGGIFIFKGISKNDIFNDMLSFDITFNNGINWYSLNKIRNEENGILTNVEEHDDELHIHWSYPGSISSPGKIFLRIGMESGCAACIKMIKLLNLNGSENW
jgi:hypothetical protein